MATFTELMEDVFTITNRPDLIQETKVALRQAIRKFHGADTFKRDLAFQSIDLQAETQNPEGSFRWAIPLTDFPRMRRPKSLHFTPVQTTNPVVAPLYDSYLVVASRQEFEQLQPDDLFNRYRNEKENYFLIVGNSLNIRSVYAAQLDFYFYQWPDIPTGMDTAIPSWIVNQCPDAVINEAAGAVFKMVGKDEEFNRYATLFVENLQILRGSDVGES